MITKRIKQIAKIIKGDGINTPEQTMGRIVVERQFKVFADGHLRLDTDAPEILLEVDGQPVGCRWSREILDEFFPDWIGLEVLN